MMTNGQDGREECFDPQRACDEQERMMIAVMRAYLRPEQAPQCLYERLRVTLDHCCDGEQVTVVHQRVIRREQRPQ